jgi:signal peptidase I
MTDSAEKYSAKRRKSVKPESNSLFAKTLRRIKANPVGAFVLDVLVIVASALILSLIIKTFLIRSFYIPSGSMETTLQINDRIIVNELVPDFVPLERGDIVVFKDPGGWLADRPAVSQPNGILAFGEWVLSVVGLSAPDSAQHLVKRVIGVGGDRVVCCDVEGKITINGKQITETYIAKGSTPSLKEFDVTVPRDMFWVMGDNRGNSEDSRFHENLPSKGFVPKASVVGRAFVLSWPFAHWKWLDNYPNVFKDVPNN